MAPPSFKLASRDARPEITENLIKINGFKTDFAMICGPCTVESEETCLRIAAKLHASGINMYRGGAYKPRTSPYAFQGLAEKGLDILNKVKRQYDMKIVTELMDTESLPSLVQIADVVQIGTRNMANYSLLKAVGKIDKPVLLKRGLCATMEEFILAAEYILAGGNKNVILCERGIRTFGTHTRGTLDLGIIPAIQQVSHLPVIVDPSHAAGKTELVRPLALAAVAAGAQGLLLECHDDPANAKCDGQQAFNPDEVSGLLKQINDIRATLTPIKKVI